METNKIYEMLDSKNDLKTQKKGIELAIKMEVIDDFILPMYPLYNKNIWENCARIIVTRNDQELIPYMMEILEWLQDLTWPGTLIILDRLMVFSGELLLEPYSKTIIHALEDEEENGEWLNHLAMLLENEKLAQMMDEDLYSKMMIRYRDFLCQ